jgi:DNA-3-methyladenine glycosylase I
VQARLRCSWTGDLPDTHPLVRYHDEEWGVPEHDDRRLFELLTLEGAQAGLSWLTVLRRRQGYRRCFLDFDFERVAAFDETDVGRLLADPGIIRNRAKLASTIANARALLAVRDEFGSFDAYLWRFVDGRPVISRFERLQQLPASTPLSRAMSRDLQKRGFRFCGPTICYALMQAAGLANDHLTSCFRFRELTTAR